MLTENMRGMIMNEDEIIATLRNWNAEAKNNRNDGWTMYHYIDKLLKVKQYVNENLSEYEPRTRSAHKQK